jgi:hypothetical protein
MQNLRNNISEALYRYFPDATPDHIEYVANNLTSAVRGYTAMKIAQHTCACESEASPDFCKGFNCAIRMASDIVQEH